MRGIGRKVGAVAILVVTAPVTIPTALIVAVVGSVLYFPKAVGWALRELFS